VFKYLSLTERVKTELRAEAFNITNTPQFTNPDSNVGVETSDESVQHGNIPNANCRWPSDSRSNFAWFSQCVATSRCSDQPNGELHLRHGARAGTLFRSAMLSQ
jgi:hypothetical protein